ncbi:adenylate/guanylate cyclase domain-containing protein [Lachnospiraceae bacterium ZAX-1]
MNIKMQVLIGIIIGIGATLLCIVLAQYIRKSNSGRHKKKEYADLSQSAQDVQGTKKVQALSYEKNAWRLLPMKLLRVIGDADTLDFALNSTKEMPSSIMSANVRDFSNHARQMQSEETYYLINQILEQCTPLVYDYGGEIGQFQDAGFEAIYLKECEKVVEAAILMCERMQKLEQERKEYKNFSIGISYGLIRVGVVGYEKRISLSTMSVYMGLAQYLRKVAVKYYSRILVTGTYIEQIADFQTKYNVRFLGYIYIHSIQAIEKIYDVFDGDPIEVRNQKRKTRIVFEKGVRLFIEKKFEEARGYFIEVLKTDRLDRAAKEYLLLCDQNWDKKKEKDSETKVFVEEY